MTLHLRHGATTSHRALLRLAVFVGLPFAVVLAAAMVARAYDTTWIAQGQTLSASKLKADLDEIQTRLAALEGVKTPPGTIVAYGGATAPAGWLLCDGKQYNGLNATYAKLYAAIGTAFGGNTSSQAFNVPDLRGRFLRGVDGDSKRDPDAQSRTAANPGGATGAAVGTVQDAQFAAHTHALFNGRAASQYGGCGFQGLNFDASIWAGDRGMCSGTPNETVGGKETRPINVAVNYLIKL